MSCGGCILDTNIYEMLAREKIQKEKILSFCSKIFLVTPNIFEILAKTNLSNYPFRKKVAEQLKIASGFLEPSVNVEKIAWGIDPIQDEREAQELFLKNFMNSTSFQEVRDLVKYSQEQRDNSYKTFQEGVSKDLKEWKSKCDLVKSSFPADTKTKSDLFYKMVMDDSKLKDFLYRSRELAFGRNDINQTNPATDAELRAATKVLGLPTLFYAGYLSHSIERAPEFNDRGDILLTLYLGFDVCLLTNDKKLLTIASEIGIEDKVFNPLKDSDEHE